MRKPSQRELERMCRYWQERLRLTDWKITISFVRRDVMLDGQGSCDMNLHSRTAVIQVLDPRDYETDLGEPQDIEDTVCHELIHLHLAPWAARNKAAMVQQEQAIESIAGALVALKRRKK